MRGKIAHEPLAQMRSSGGKRMPGPEGIVLAGHRQAAGRTMYTDAPSGGLRERPTSRGLFLAAISETFLRSASGTPTWRRQPCSSSHPAQAVVSSRAHDGERQEKKRGP